MENGRQFVQIVVEEVYVNITFQMDDVKSVEVAKFAYTELTVTIVGSVEAMEFANMESRRDIVSNARVQGYAFTNGKNMSA